MSTTHRSQPDRRRSELALIHVLAKQAGLDPKDKDPGSAYRQMLRQHGGADSSGAMNAHQRSAVIRHLDRSQTARKAQPKRGNPRSRLIRHIWSCLADAGVVKSEAGLNAWTKRWTKIDTPNGYDRPELLPADVASRLIEQLKQWAERENAEWKNP